MEKIYNFCHRHRRFLPSSTRTRTFLISFLLWAGLLSTFQAAPLPTKNALPTVAKPLNWLSLLFPEQIKPPFVVSTATPLALPACTLSISGSTSGCYYNGSASKATVTIEVHWTGSPGTITVQLNGGNNKTINTSNYFTPQVVAYEVDANGGSGIVSASASGGCSATSYTFNAPAACAPASCGASNINGTVFQDFNANGVKETGDNAGLENVTVTAISDDGTTFTGTTNSFGQYSLTVNSAKFPYRVEFSNLPAQFGEGTPNGADGRTSVQFVTSADKCTVDLGVLDPNFYCQNDPYVMIPCWVNGDPLDNNATEDAFVRFRYSLRGDKNTSQMTKLAGAGQIGATWGVAYNKYRNDVYTSAVLRRHVGLTTGSGAGSDVGRLGAIFTTANVKNASPGATTLWTDVSSLVGTYQSNDARGLPSTPSSGASNSPSTDAQAYDDIAKKGIGDIEVDDEGKYLYFTDLTNQQLARIDINNDGTAGGVSTFPITGVNCTTGQMRPWGLKYYKGLLYVGVVCDASTSQNRSDLRAYVLSFNPASASFSTVFSFPLTYPKGDVNGESDTEWKPWTPTGSAGHTIFSNNRTYIQPILSDIEFDVEGSMVLGLADRYGLQGGYKNYHPNGTGGSYTTWSGGDILRAVLINGTYILENAGKAGPTTGASPTNNQGPGFGEFYYDDFVYHRETALGGLALRPGSGEIVTTTMDPVEVYIWSGGIRYLANTGANAGKYVTGNNNTSAYIVYKTESGDPGTFGKAAGLGDIELACDLPSYLEIGNRIWVDQDKDGIQDPGEPPLQGIAVQLVNAANTPVGNTTTNTSGEYYFNSSNSSITAGATYTIRVNTSASNLAPYSLTDANAAGSNDLNDSDAILNGANAEISVPALTSASVNHTYDIGFFCNFTVAASVNPTSLCVGNTTQLSVDVAGATAYSWGKSSSNAGSFTANVQNPTVSNLNTTGNFSYTVTVTSGLCTATSSVSINVVALTATASANPSSICSGDQVTLSAGPVGGYTYSWAGPNGAGTFSDGTAQAPTLSGFSGGGTFTYSVTVSSGGCTSSATTTVKVNTSVSVSANTSAICSGGTLQLNSTVTQGAFSWKGPNNLVTLAASPTINIPNATTADAGVYSLTVTNTSGCTGSTTISATVYANPSIILSGPPVCAGQSLVFTATPTAGSSNTLNVYSWNGPAAFATTTSVPTLSRPSATTAMSGNYTVVVRDGNSCTASTSVSTTVHPLPVAALSYTGPVCVGGTIHLSASGGLFYSWAGPPSFTSSDQSPFLPNAQANQNGIYSATVTGTGGCTATATLSVVVNTPPSVTLSAPAVCAGATLNINANVTPGSSNTFTYSWRGPAFNSTTTTPLLARSLSTTSMSGRYTVTVVDGNGCTASNTVSATVNAVPSINLTGAQVCVGQTLNLSGTVTLGTSQTISTYSWAGPPSGFTTTTVGPNLSRTNAQTNMTGNYTITITDGNGCTATASTTGVVNPLPTLAPTSPPACANEPLQLNANAAAGTPGYTYSWTGPGTINTSVLANPTVTGLAAGLRTFTVTVSDINSCTATAQTLATIRAVPVVSPSSTAICAGLTLNLSSNASGGIPGYTYSWDGPGTINTSSSVNPTVAGLTFGTYVYSVTVRDSYSCSVTGQTTATVHKLPVVQINSTPVCAGQTLTVNTQVTLGSATTISQYLWSGPNFTSLQAGPSLSYPASTTNLSGTYTVTIRDANSCTATAIGTALVKPVPNPTASVAISPICANENISLSVNSTINSPGAISYSWTAPNGSFLSNQQNPTVNNAQANQSGAYKVIMNLNGCTASSSVNVTVKPLATPVVSAPAVCEGIALNLYASGGDSYSWSFPGFTSTEQNPARLSATLSMAGIYTVTIGKDGCTIAATVNVTIKPNPIVTANANPGAVCIGGSFSLNGTSNLGGSYFWSGPNFSSQQQTPILTNATQGMGGQYILTVVANGCTGIATTNVNIKQPPGYTITGDNVCSGSNIRIRATGGSSYSWRGPNSFQSADSNPLIAGSSILNDGIYSVTITGDNGCTVSATTSVRVDEPTPIIVSSNSPICINGSIQLSATGGQTYSWKGPNNFTSFSNNPTIPATSTLVAGVYTVSSKMFPPNLCTNSNTISIVISQQGASASSNTPVCVGGQIQLRSSSGGTSYSWAAPNEPSFTSTVQNPIRDNATTTMGGLYTVTIQGNSGCTGTATTSVLIISPPSISVSVSNGENNAQCTGGDIQLTAQSNATSYSWKGPNNFISFEQNPKLTNVTTSTGGIYTVSAQGIEGCTATATIIVAVKPCFGSLGDKVWKDFDKDGIQDLGEPGVPAVTVELYKSNPDGTLIGGVLASKTTDGNGMYQFTDLESGNYRVKFIIPSNMDMTLTQKDQGADDGLDSDADPLSGFSQVVPISTSGTGIQKDNPTIDAGVIQNYASLGDYVWKDLNKNGIQDENEPGVQGVIVELYKAKTDGSPDGAALSSKLTNSVGFYEFTQLASGDYVVKFTMPTSMNMPFTTKDQGNDDAKDSDADPSTGLSPKVTLNANGSGIAKDNPTIDAGVINPPLGSIGDYVWKDTDKDGIQDDNEIGVPGVTVELYKTDANGTPQGAAIATKTTDASGYYLFAGLDSGDYKVKFIMPANMNMPFTLKDQGNNDGKDSDVDPETGFSPKVTINVNGTGPNDKDNPTIDAGVFTPITILGSIGDQVWKDANGNGRQDLTSEEGVKNITVELYKVENGVRGGTPIASTITDGNGYYLFTNLPTGDYQVRFVPSSFPADCNKLTAIDQGNDDTKDSDANVDTGFSPVVQLRPEQGGLLKDNPTIDAGLLPTALGSIGDYVWKDANKNGIQDQTELPVPGIVVELYNSDANGALLGAAIATQVTDANGKYLFDKLPSGNYRVKFIIPQTMIDMALTSKNQGEDDTKDSDADPTSGLSQVVNINVSGAGIAKDNPTIDAGLIQNYGSIGDYVWKDLDKDGFQDDNEPGVPGITVELYKTDANGTPQGAAIATKVTDANGKYLFDLLPSGDYKVKFIVPTNMNMPFTTKDTPTDDAKDSDADPNTGFSPKVTINASGTGIAKDNPTVDAGLINPTLGSIGDQVWKDANGNGRQDLTSENGIKGVTVELYKLDANGARPTTPLATQVTDEQGYYLFKDLVAGQYQVRFVPSSFPADCSKLTAPDSGNDDSKDSDANVDTGFTPVIPMNPDAGGILKDNPTIDAGLLPTVLGSIGDYVWKDTDKDGFQDPEEKGVPGVTVELYKSDANGNLQGAAIATQVTDANGYYLFDKLASGDYRVKFIVPTNMDMSLTTKDTPTDDAKDSDADPTSGLSQVVNINVLGSGIAKDNPTIDAGLIQNYGSIGDYVWKDLDKDGFQDDNEPGVPGITVELYKTDANGTPQGAAIATKVTDANGKYLFDLLPSGDYKVKFIVPTNMNMPFTTKDTPTDDAKDSDADPNTGFSPKVTINASGTGIAKDNPTVDAGLINPTLGSIGDQVWKDANGNGRQDLTSEEGVKGVTVELYKLDANGARPTTPLATQVTDDQGYYLFKDLVAGQYQVRFVPSSFPADCSKLTAPDSGNDDSKDSDANVDTGFTPVIPLNPDAGGIFKDNPTIDAGLLPQFGSIGNYVWLDVDMDGQQDKEESPIKDVKVLLFNDKGEQLRSMMTNDKGEYLFDKLLSGKYYVKFMAPEGTEFTKKDTGADDTIDSDAADDGSTPVVMINAGLPSGDIGRDNPTIDAGIVPAYGSIGDFVWKDTNGNGIQDEGEKGVPNLKVYLLDGSGNKLDETTTDANGGYKFEHLLTGKYQIKIPTIPTDCDYTTPNQGINDNKDSDFGKDGLSPVITINTALPKGNIGRDNPSIDAGLVNQLGSIGDYVWFDKDNDGIQEANEAPIPNFKVELYNADTKALLATQFTNNEGKYLFDGLVTGKYQVRFVLPTEWLPWNPITQRYQGSDPAKDSNAEAPTAGWSEIVMIETIYPKGDIRRDNPTIDGGIDPFGSVGDFVWQDNNQNGIQDQGEPGVPGVKVVLLNADKTIEIATKYTDNTGYYRFDSLIDGRYYIKFVLPSNSSFTTANVGINDSVDSDAKEDGCSDYFDIVLTTNFLDVRRNNYTLDAGIIPCVKPDFTVATIQATCDGGSPKADAQLMIQGFQNGWRYDFSVGNTYVGGKSYATGTVIPPNGVIANNLANPATEQNYTVRVWSSAEGCYTDKTITLTKKDCGCVDPKCIPFIIIKK